MSVTREPTREDYQRALVPLGLSAEELVARYEALPVSDRVHREALAEAVRWRTTDRNLWARVGLGTEWGGA